MTQAGGQRPVMSLDLLWAAGHPVVPNGTLKIRSW
jgi:hypothetical protein